MCDGCVGILGGTPSSENIDTIDTTVTERMDLMKNIQISYDLFMALIRYHLVADDECLDTIRQGLEQKLEALVRRELYVKYKTAPTEEERENARKEYLDRRGVPERFRW